MNLKYYEKIYLLNDNAHKIGWIHHLYKFFSKKRLQKIDEKILLMILKIQNQSHPDINI